MVDQQSPHVLRFIAHPREWAQGHQEISPQDRLTTGWFITKLEGSPQSHMRVRHNVRMHYKTPKMKLIQRVIDFLLQFQLRQIKHIA